MREHAAGVIIVFASLYLLGCAERREGIPVGEVSDSAGLRLITYELADIEVPPYRRLGDFDLQVGAVDGAPQDVFSQITDMALFADGSILVSDRIARELRVFDPAGAFVRSIGRPGEGPGEFSSPPSVAGISGDTVFTFDRQASRVSVFERDGDLLNTVTVRPDDVGLADVVVRLSDGTFLVQSRWSDPDAAVAFHDMRLELDSAVVFRVDADGMVLDTIEVIADRARARIVQDAGQGQVRTMQANTPHSVRAVVASSGEGSIVGHTGEFELRARSEEGAADFVLRVRGVEHPATAAEIRTRQEAAIRERMGDQELEPNLRRLNLDFLPETLPSFANALVSEAGNIWVGLTEYDLSDGTDWLVFDGEGVLLGSVRTPPEFRLRSIRTDYLVGFVLDDLDVPFVRRYPFAPNGAD